VQLCHRFATAILHLVPSLLWFSLAVPYLLHSAEDQQVVITHDLDLQLIQIGSVQLLSDLGGCKRREQGIVKISTQNLGLASGVISDELACFGAGWRSAQVRHKENRSAPGVFPDGLPQNLRLVEMMQKAA